jgi:SAM-dependent methyltransferase
LDQFGLPCETTVSNKFGLIFTSLRLDKNSTSLFYDKYYRKIYEGVPGPSLEHPYYLKLFSGWVPKVPRFVKDNWRVVEFGCGGGWNLRPYKSKNIAYEGWDYDTAMVQFGRNQFDLNLFEGGVDHFLTTGRRADYVILSQVLEHVDNPISYLKRVKSCLTPGGLVAIYVPSIEYVRYLGGNSTHWDLQMNLQNAHNYIFSEQTLRAVLLSAGFSPHLVVGGYALGKIDKRLGEMSVEDCFDTNVYQLLLKFQKAVEVKNFVHHSSPRFFRRFFLDRIFYFLNPIKTLRRIGVERFGII